MRRILILAVVGSLYSYAGNIDDYMQKLYNAVKSSNSNFKGFSAKRGEKIFFSKHMGKRGKIISCASCHTDNIKNMGENIFTGKKIKPLSPKANAKRLTNVKNVKKWLRRNFKDVYKREGTPLEKGDVLTFIANQ